MNQEMIEVVLSYPKLVNRINSRENKEKERENVIKNLQEIHADFSPTTINRVLKLLDLAISKFYDSINLYTENTLNIDEALSKDHLVFVPNHQSHADYVALNYVFYKKYKRPLFVAGGINLNIFPVGSLFRKAGCFFIRRSFASDILYKLTLEAYIYYLLKNKCPIEFFFEGGRSRTGKLLSPRFGMYQMITEAYTFLPEESRGRLIFIPVSIVHEYVPEQKSMAKELKGAKKKKESTGELLKLFNLFSKEFGSVHLTLGGPVIPVFNDVTYDPNDTKKFINKIAFDCFDVVCKNMKVTPSSLLAIILLDTPSGAIRWEDILTRAQLILNYCQLNNIPYVESLKKENLIATLERSIDLFIANKKIDVIGRNRYGHVYYFIQDELRLEMLYFKNSIIHYFFIPWLINIAKINIQMNRITTFSDLKKFVVDKRNLLKGELLLGPIDDFLKNAFSDISQAINREVSSLRGCMTLNHQEMYLLNKNLGIFSRCCSYIFEGYYVVVLAIKKLSDKDNNENNSNNNENCFSFDEFLSQKETIFIEEIKKGEVIRYTESNSLPLIKNCFKYITDLEVIALDDRGRYRLLNRDLLNEHIEMYYEILSEQMCII